MLHLWGSPTSPEVWKRWRWDCWPVEFRGRHPTCSQRPWWNMVELPSETLPGPLGHCFFCFTLDSSEGRSTFSKSFKSSKVLSILFGQPLADWYPSLVPLVINYWKNDTYNCTQGNLQPSSAELPPKLMELELPCEMWKNTGKKAMTQAGRSLYYRVKLLGTCLNSLQFQTGCISKKQLGFSLWFRCAHTIRGIRIRDDGDQRTSQR